ncbi:MAG: GAK system XXXCH domain-containing protein [Thermodesulfobacteriota bacterium]
MEFTALKSGMDRTFQEIQTRTSHGELPELERVGAFVRLCRQLHTQAPDEWADEAGDFSHMAEKLLQAVKNGSVEESVLCVESLNEAQTYCHRMFKD